MEQGIRAKTTRSRKIILLLFILCLLTITAFLFIGITQKNIGFFMPRRLNKIITIILVSYSIGASSVTFQTITNNRILTPSVMGLDSLYMFIQTVVVFFFGSGQLTLMTGYGNYILSIGLMVLASGILFFFLFRSECSNNVYFMVLTGMVMGGLFSGMATFMQVLLDPNEFTILEGKMFASFNNINSDLILISALIIIIILLITTKDMPYLDVLSLGKDNAINLGVDYKKIVLKTLITSTILISVSTALVGPITFLGILVVNLAKQITQTYAHKYLTVITTLLGVLFLTLGLLITERIFHFETKVSMIINFIGGIYFIYLMIKESKA